MSDARSDEASFEMSDGRSYEVSSRVSFLLCSPANSEASFLASFQRSFDGCLERPSDQFAVGQPEVAEAGLGELGGSLVDSRIVSSWGSWRTWRAALERGGLNNGCGESTDLALVVPCSTAPPGPDACVLWHAVSHAQSSQETRPTARLQQPGRPDSIRDVAQDAGKQSLRQQIGIWLNK